LGAIGVTGSTAANAAAQAADLVVGIGTRLQDFTTGSRSLFPQARLFQVNVQPLDAHKHGATAVVGDARLVLETLREGLGDWRVEEGVARRNAAAIAAWNEQVDAATAPGAAGEAPSDAQVLGAVQ